MSAPSTVNIAELIGQRPLGRLQIRISVLCGLVALLDGFDLLAIGVAAPAMAGPLHIAPNQFGAVFSAALFGLMLKVMFGPTAPISGLGSTLRRLPAPMTKLCDPPRVNESAGELSSITGGYDNYASGNSATVTGGTGNNASNPFDDLPWP